MVGENYTNTFGGENVSPANLSYVAYTISTNIDLTWAFEAVEGANVTADKIDINCSAINSTVRMPPANQVTVGQDCLFGNVGTQPFVVVDNGGNLICTVASGLEWFVFLTDNTTPHGVWRSVQFGASTSVANAASLAGAGLRAHISQLDQHLLTTALTSSYTIVDSDRATVVENTGGLVTYTFPDAGVVGNGWFVYIINAGTGNIILTPVGGDTLDGAPTKTISPGESLAVLSDGSNYHSLGYGRSIVTSVTGTSISVGGAAGTVVLSATQVAAQIQDFTGVLTGNRRIEYGASIGYWFVYNHTTPATPFTMTMATVGGDPGVIVPQGAFSIVRSNGANMAVAFSGAVGTVTSVATTANLIGGPITTSGTLDLSSTGVTAGTYGDASHVSQVQIDIKGRIVTATAPSISIATSQINDITSLIPPGMIMPWAAWTTISIPVGWLLCDGSVVAIATYPNLYATIGGAYGATTGTTFTLPDTRGCVLMGQDPGYRVTAAYFPGGNPNLVGSHGGGHAIQSTTTVGGLGVSGGYPYGYGGMVGRVDGVLRFLLDQGHTDSPTDTGDMGTSVTGGGGGAANTYHTHRVNASWALAPNSGSFNDIYIRTDLSYFNGKIDAGSAATSGYFSIVQPTLVVRYLIKY